MQGSGCLVTASLRLEKQIFAAFSDFRTRVASEKHHVTGTRLAIATVREISAGLPVSPL